MFVISKRNPTPLSFPNPPQPPALSRRKSTSCLWISGPGRVMPVESYNRWSSVSVSFLFASCSRGPSTVWEASELHLFHSWIVCPGVDLPILFISRHPQFLKDLRTIAGNRAVCNSILFLLPASSSPLSCTLDFFPPICSPFFPSHPESDLFSLRPLLCSDLS